MAVATATLASAGMPRYQHATAAMTTMRRRLGSRVTPAAALYSNAAAAATATASTRNATSGSQTMAATATSARTTPLTRRVMRASARRRCRRRGDAAVAALALLIREHGVEQVTPPEVGPQRVGDVDLGVGNLPQQVVAHAHFTARADHQVRVGLPGGVEKAREAGLVEVLGPHAGCDGAPCGVDDLG